MMSLYTIVCPPLFLDWMKFYKADKSRYRNNCRVHIWMIVNITSLCNSRSVAESWRLSRQLYLWYQAIFVAEHLLLCVPIIKLRFNIASRNADLAEAGLQLMAEERHSMQTVNW